MNATKRMTQAESKVKKVYFIFLKLIIRCVLFISLGLQGVLIGFIILCLHTYNVAVPLSLPLQNAVILQTSLFVAVGA